MPKSIEEITADIVIAVVQAQPSWIYRTAGAEADTTALIKLIRDVHQTLTDLHKRNLK